jgi:hypothetical protein
MGKTSTWKLHYDDPNDIAKGRQQAQKLAESADAAISTCKEQVYQDYTGKIAQAESQANDYTDRQVQAAKVERNTQIDLVNKNIEANKKDIEQKLSTATTEAVQRERRMKAEAISEANAFLTDRVPVNIGPDETWFTYKDAASLPAWPLASAPNNSVIILYAINSGTAWNVAVEAGQFYIFNKDSKGNTHYAQISNPYSLTRIVPLANDVVEFFTSEKASTKKLHARLAEAEAAIAGLKAELAELKKKQA